MIGDVGTSYYCASVVMNPLRSIIVLHRPINLNTENIKKYCFISQFFHFYSKIYEYVDDFCVTSVSCL